jgi:hypothetical protein
LKFDGTDIEQGILDVVNKIIDDPLKNIQKRTWLVKVLPLQNCVLGQSTSLLSTEFQGSQTTSTFIEIRLTKN